MCFPWVVLCVCVFPVGRVCLVGCVVCVCVPFSGVFYECVNKKKVFFKSARVYKMFRKCFQGVSQVFLHWGTKEWNGYRSFCRATSGGFAKLVLIMTAVRIRRFLCFRFAVRCFINADGFAARLYGVSGRSSQKLVLPLFFDDPRVHIDIVVAFHFASHESQAAPIPRIPKSGPFSRPQSFV